MRSYTQRNPIVLGLVSLITIVTLLLLAYNVDELPLIGAGTQYRAEFTESAGLEADDEVRVAGVKIGNVSAVELDGNKVVVSFYAGDAFIGALSTASIQVKTLLGDKFLAIDPLGADELDPDTPIPLQRTVTPYDVVEAFNALSSTVRELDTDQLAASLRTIAATFRETPAAVRASLDGLSRLSTTIASRDEQLAALLANTNKVTGLLAARNQEIELILRDGGTLLAELNARQEAISRLLDGTRRLSAQLRGLVEDNEKRIGNTLDQLERLVDILQRNQDALVDGLRRLGPFTTLFTNLVGSGRWFDNFLEATSALPINLEGAPGAPPVPVPVPAPAPVGGAGR